MFKGIIALFTSGVIFNPLVLLGIVSGAFAVMNLKPEEIKDLFSDYSFYGVVAFVALAYTVSFAKIYKNGGIEINWPATLGLSVWNFVKYFIAFSLTMSFVVMMSF